MFAPPSSSRKRKRGDERLHLGTPFVIQQHIASSFDVSTKVSPTVIIPRAHVPVSWLAGSPSRLFDTPAESTALCAPGYAVIVKIEGERQLSAVEKVGDNVYALYRLSTQLRMKDVRKIASQTKHLPYRDAGVAMYDVCEQQWWCEVGSTSYPFEDSPVHSAALDMGAVGANTIDEPDDLLNVARLPPSPLLLLPEAEILTQEDIQPSMSEILDQVRRQYFETLYLAKTSLAYFAKSTLSRARATCLDFEGMPPASRFDELTEFLRKMILPLDKMDIKYKKSLVQSALENEVDDPAVFRPDEDGYVQRWRYSAFQERFIRESDAELKQKLEGLRIRETELQIILLLEILALNKEHPPTTTEIAESPKGKKGKSKGKEKKKKKKKSKCVDKVPEPDVLLDLLVDRLCIWHSIGSDSTTEKGESPARGKDAVSEKDHLRHFSVEVIMAFYSSKLPEKCASINKKFGGRAISASNSASSINRQTKASKDQRAPIKKAPGLRRSNTLPSTTSRSRGTTAEPLSLLAAEGVSAPKTIRGGTLNSRSFTKKIVQMDKPTQKKVDEELKSVIQALAKPNRVAAANEFFEEAERRLAKPIAKKPRKTAKVTGPDVHVAATPQKPKKDIFASLHPDEFIAREFGAPGNSAASLHISSADVAATPPPRRQARPSNRASLDGDGVVLATPRKGLFADLQRSAGQQPRALPRSILASNGDDVTIFATPQKKRVGNSGFGSPAGSVDVAKETPLKILSSAGLGRVQAGRQPVERLEEGAGGGETSIYDALGWGDDDAL